MKYHNLLGFIAFVALAANVAAQGREGTNKTAAQVMVEIVNVAVAEFRLELKDSQSARFRNSYFRGSVGGDGEIHLTLCGEVNARNSFGGYSGWRPFYATQKEMVYGSRLVPLVCNPEHPGWIRDTDFSYFLQRDVTAP